MRQDNILSSCRLARGRWPGDPRTLAGRPRCSMSRFAHPAPSPSRHWITTPSHWFGCMAWGLGVSVVAAAGRCRRHAHRSVVLRRTSFPRIPCRWPIAWLISRVLRLASIRRSAHGFLSGVWPMSRGHKLGRHYPLLQMCSHIGAGFGLYCPLFLPLFRYLASLAWLRVVVGVQWRASAQCCAILVGASRDNNRALTIVQREVARRLVHFHLRCLPPLQPSLFLSFVVRIWKMV